MTPEELAAETKQRDVVQQDERRYCCPTLSEPLQFQVISNHFATKTILQILQDLRASRTAQTLMINRLDDIERRRPQGLCHENFEMILQQVKFNFCDLLFAFHRIK